MKPVFRSIDEVIALGALALGTAALWARPRGTMPAVAITAGVGLLGLVLPVPLRRQPRASMSQWMLVAALGVAAFLAARLAVLLIPVPVSGAAIVAGLVAAVGEEAFFRRLLYGWLERWGTAAAIAGSAALFAAIHFPSYGLGAMPIDFAAGLLFGWQRWASGTWSAPAVTHAAANLLQLG
ncbi:MAG: lysostaphin resistance A-like protein [bacterium]